LPISFEDIVLSTEKDSGRSRHRIIRHATLSSVILDEVTLKTRNSKLRVSPARAAAFDILLRVERESSYASELLHSATNASLTALDYSLITELVMGVLRWQSFLDAKIARYSSQPLTKLDREILIALRLAAYQIDWLTRVPARAAINESVELVKRARKRSAAPFVNAILRKFETSSPGAPDAVGASPEALAASTAHPAWLVERWWHSYGPEAALEICRHDQAIPVTAIRLRDQRAEDRLRSEGIELVPGVLLASARRVIHGDITKTTAYRDGLCSIQDEASQLVAALVGRGSCILDCCASPGGKTSVLADHNPQSLIIAVDLHPHRARLLRRMVCGPRSQNKAPLTNVQVVAADARSLPFATKFDRVLADVPCSGTGTLSRNPEIKWRITPEDIADLQLRQIAILRSAMDQVATNGRLIYSTCSLEQEENEDVISQALDGNSSFRVVDCGAELQKLYEQGMTVVRDSSSLTRGPYLRTLPGVHPSDGFFAAILEKFA
jgi:16S rRNA (cytosine967-C5)-methyltransferase